MLVNKLGDPCYKVAANAAHLLTKLGGLITAFFVLSLCNYFSVVYGPRAGSGVVRMDPLHFLAGCRTRRLNQAYV